MPNKLPAQEPLFSAPKLHTFGRFEWDGELASPAPGGREFLRETRKELLNS